MEHNLDSFIIPKEAELDDSFSDALIHKLGIVIKSYVNSMLGEAWKRVSHGDGYVIKNVCEYPWINTLSELVPRMPILSVYRLNMRKVPFTMYKDYIESDIQCDLILPITDFNNDVKYGILANYVMVLESMISRSLTSGNMYDVDGYTLAEYLGCENVKLSESKLSQLKSREGLHAGFYIASTKILTRELISMADETAGIEDLDNIDIDLDLENTDGYVAISPFLEIKPI